METILMNKGFLKTENPNQYEKNDWTIRLDKDKIEVFNNPDKAAGIYYIGPINTTDIEQLLLEINDSLLEQSQK